MAGPPFDIVGDIQLVEAQGSAQLSQPAAQFVWGAVLLDTAKGPADDELLSSAGGGYVEQAVRFGFLLVRLALARQTVDGGGLIIGTPLDGQQDAVQRVDQDTASSGPAGPACVT